MCYCFPGLTNTKDIGSLVSTLPKLNDHRLLDLFLVVLYSDDITGSLPIELPVPDINGWETNERALPDPTA